MRLRTGCIVLISTIFFQMSLLAQTTLEENRDIASNRACELRKHMMNGVTDLDFNNILQTQTTTMTGKKKPIIGILLCGCARGWRILCRFLDQGSYFPGGGSGPLGWVCPIYG